MEFVLRRNWCVDVNDSAWDIKSLKYKTKIVGETPERPAQPANIGDTDSLAQLPVPSLNV